MATGYIVYSSGKHCFLGSSLKEHRQYENPKMKEVGEIRERGIQWNVLMDFTPFKLLIL